MTARTDVRTDVPSPANAARKTPDQEPGPQTKPRGEQRWATLWRFLPYLWPRGRWRIRLLVIAAMLALLLSRVLNISVPISMEWIINHINNFDADIGLLTIPFGLILFHGLMRLLTQSMGELRDGLFAPVSQNAIRTLALETFRHLHGLSLRFHLDRQTGGLSRAIERGTKGIEFLIRFMMFNLIPTTIEILLVSALMWVRYGPGYALVTLVTLFGYIYYTIAVTEWRIRFRRQMNAADEMANTKAIDSLLNYETVKYFSNEAHEARRYDGALRKYEGAAIRSQVSLSALNIGQGFIISAGIVVLLIMAAYDVRANVFEIGAFAGIYLFILQLYAPLNFLGFAYREIRQALIDMEYMFNILEVNQEVADRPQAKPLEINGAALRLRNLDFSYNQERQILHGLDIEVAPGETVAIVGPSGSGKSTIGRLLFRFYDVSSGAIEIDGQDLRNVTQASLRMALGIVPQDTVLFNDTIFYNIAYGHPGATRSEVVQAAKIARIHDFIEALPQGYDTVVGERGLKLSGGERQRVSIARTVLKNPPILLFDEATSSLDSETEAAIQTSLEEVSSERTTLVIAHRLSTVVNADKIVVLKQGRLVEQGRHEELLAKGGEYAGMWHTQQQDSDGL